MAAAFLPLGAFAEFDPARYCKTDVVRGTTLFVGLNCLEPGQSQAVHAHAGADKVYVVLEGKARFVVGDETADAGAGTLVHAPAGVPHGVEIAHERTVLLVAMAPPPAG